MAELTANQKSLVGYMKKSEQHAAHGFDLILKNADAGMFFDELRAGGFFDPSRNPEPRAVDGQEGFFRIPFWNALKYLNQVAEDARKNGDQELGIKLMEVVRSAMVSDDGVVTDNYHTYAAFAEIIGRVPSACVTLADMDLAGKFLATRWDNSLVVSALDRAISALLADGAPDSCAKAVRLLEQCTELRPSNDADRSMREFVPVAESYWLEKLLRHNSEKFGQRAGESAIACLSSRVSQLFSADYISTHSWMWRAAIEEHEQNHDWDNITNAFVESLRDALDAWIRSDPASAAPFVRSALGNPSQIIRRIAIDALRTEWDLLSGVFEDELSPSLFEIGQIHETYKLLHDRFSQFSSETQERVIQLIHDLGEVNDDDVDEVERALLRKRNWLHAIVGFGHEAVDKEYARLVTIVGPVGEYPDLLTYHYSSWVSGDKSPYGAAELVAFSDDRSLIERIESFTPTQDERSSRKGLLDELAAAIQAEPRKFMWMIKGGVEVRRSTQYGLIRGYANALDGLKSSEDLTLRRSLLNAFLPYLQSLVGSAEFWEEPTEDAGRFEPDRDWIPPVIVEVVKKLASDDAIPLLEYDFGLMLSIVLAVKASAPGISMSDDPMTSAINNPRGMAVEALLQFVLRRCRDADKVEKTHVDAWLALKAELDAEVACCVDGGCLESSTLLASYLAQLIYVDSDWVSENIQRIFSEAHRDNFVCAIAGLSFANANGRLYEILREANIPRRALQSEHIKGSARERLLERIALAYGWGLVEVHSPELAEMFSSDRVDDLIEVASTISRWSSDKISDEQASRVTDFARSVVAFGLEEVTSRKKLLRVASRFISFLPALSEDNMSWLLPAASYAYSSYGSDDFLESLDRLGGDNALNVQRILEAFLENYEFSDDFRGRLQSIVRKIDQGGRHLEALLIVEQIVKRGGGAQWVALYKELVEDGHRTNL